MRVCVCVCWYPTYFVRCVLAYFFSLAQHHNMRCNAFKIKPGIESFAKDDSANIVFNQNIWISLHLEVSLNWSRITLDVFPGARNSKRYMTTYGMHLNNIILLKRPDQHLFFIFASWLCSVARKRRRDGEREEKKPLNYKRNNCEIKNLLIIIIILWSRSFCVSLVFCLLSHFFFLVLVPLMHVSTKRN